MGRDVFEAGVYRGDCGGDVDELVDGCGDVEVCWRIDRGHGLC